MWVRVIVHAYAHLLFAHTCFVFALRGFIVLLCCGMPAGNLFWANLEVRSGVRVKLDSADGGQVGKD